MNLDPAFFPALRELATELGVVPTWLLVIFYEESRLDPRAHRTGSRYFGLNQIDEARLVERGVSPIDYLTWSASAQVERVIGPWYLDTARTYLPGRVARSVGVLYALNILPGRVLERGDSPSTVLASATDPDTYYRDNAGLDLDHKGYFTIADLDRFLVKKAMEEPYQEALVMLQAPELAPATGGKIMFLIAAAIAAAAGYLLYR